MKRLAGLLVAGMMMTGTANALVDSEELTCIGNVYNKGTTVEYTVELSDLLPGFKGHDHVSVSVGEIVYGAEKELVWPSRTIASDAKADLFQNENVTKIRFDGGEINFIDDAQTDGRPLHGTLIIDHSFRTLSVFCN